MAEHTAVAAPRDPVAATPATPAPSRRPGGFTLVEMLVVLVIIAALIGMAATGIPAAMRAQRRTQATSLITQVQGALMSMQVDKESYGRYPPTRCVDIRIGRKLVGKELGTPSNDLNVGIETVWFLTNHPDIPVKQVTNNAEQIQNCDADNFRASLSTASDSEAREYVDPWGWPLVYFHNMDYKDPKGCTRIKGLGGEVIEVRPKRLPKAKGGQYLGPNSFQLFSVGPNGQQDPDDAEESDDIVVTGE
jgi:prepilin-type N-terminal cleavage/methylation domain-containing protein